MSHICFTFECKKYTVNPVNTPWTYTRTKDKFNLIIASRDSKSNLIFYNAFFCSFDLNLPLDISFRFDLNIFRSFFASSSFISPDCIFPKSSVPLLKSSNLFLAVLSVK